MPEGTVYVRKRSLYQLEDFGIGFGWLNNGKSRGVGRWEGMGASYFKYSTLGFTLGVCSAQAGQCTQNKPQFRCALWRVLLSITSCSFSGGCAERFYGDKLPKPGSGTSLSPSCFHFAKTRVHLYTEKCLTTTSSPGGIFGDICHWYFSEPQLPGQNGNAGSIPMTLSCSLCRFMLV